MKISLSDRGCRSSNRGVPHGSSRAVALLAAVVIVLVSLAVGLAPVQASILAAAPTPQGFWPTNPVPAAPSANDGSAVELGIKFRTSTVGSVVGLRFYKGSGNTGTHTGSIWSASGTRLVTATFSGETAGGWQTVSFAKPVSISANTTYVASYYAPMGHYAYTYDQFTTALVAGSLTAPAGANGVYRYGSSGFPTSSWRSTNYWVEPLFLPATAPPTSSTSAVSTTPVTTTTSRSTSASVSPTSTTSASASPTASPSPTNTTTPATTTTTPPPPLCSTSQVWQNLDVCGWPGPASTGYPDGQVFAKTVTGGLVVTADGTVIDGYRVSGGIQVRAQNVVIRNSWVTNSAGGAGGSGVVNINPGFSATIDHSLLDGSNATHACIWHEGKSMVATGNECVGVNDGIFSWATQTGVDGTGDSFRIEGNWLHAFTTQAANGHIDGYQTEGAKHGVIRHNTIDVSQDQDSTIAIWNSRKSADDIVVDNNLLAGGGFAAYAEDYSPSEANPAGGYTVTNVSFTNNRFSTVHYGCVGYWGVWFPRGAPSDGWKRTGNTVLETGQKVDAGNPTNNGTPCN